MPNGLNNWSYRDVKDFLEKHSFRFHKDAPGSHEYWISEDEKCIVDVNFIQGSESYPPRTLESMIRDAILILKKDHWRKWAETGGYCCKKDKKNKEIPKPIGDPKIEE